MDGEMSSMDESVIRGCHSWMNPPSLDVIHGWHPWMKMTDDRHGRSISCKHLKYDRLSASLAHKVTLLAHLYSVPQTVSLGEQTMD